MQKSRKSFWKSSRGSVTPSHKKEWLPLFVAQAGKNAPRLKRVVFGKKAKPWDLKGQYRKMEMQRINGKLMYEMMETPEGRKVLLKNVNSVAEQLADFLAENMKLGVSHGEVEAWHLFVQKKKKGGIKIKPFDYGMGSVMDSEKVNSPYSKADSYFTGSIFGTDYKKSMVVLEKIVMRSELPLREKLKKSEEIKKYFEDKLEEKIRG